MPEENPGLAGFGLSFTKLIINVDDHLLIQAGIDHRTFQ